MWQGSWFQQRAESIPVPLPRPTKVPDDSAPFPTIGIVRIIYKGASLRSIFLGGEVLCSPGGVRQSRHYLCRAIIVNLGKVTFFLSGPSSSSGRDPTILLV